MSDETALLVLPPFCLLTTLDDIRIANRLAERVLGPMFRELPKATENLLAALVTMVYAASVEQHVLPESHRFTRKDIRRALFGQGKLSFSLTHLKRHLALLEEYEYLIVHTGGGLGRRKVYQLNYDRHQDGQPGDPTTGLIDVEALESVGTKE